MPLTRSRCELAVGYTRFIASQSTGGDNNNKILEARTPCAMVVYVMPSKLIFVYVIIPLMVDVYVFIPLCWDLCTLFS